MLGEAHMQHLLPITRNFSQFQTQSLQLIGEADKLRPLVVPLGPVLPVLGQGAARGSLVTLPLHIALPVTSHQLS